MIVFDEIVSWERPGENVESRCRIRIVKLNGNGAVTHLKNYYVVASDLGAEAGPSLANSARFLIPGVCAEHGIDITEMIWFQHDPQKASLDVAIAKPSSSCCARGCSKMIDVTWRPARNNEIDHLKHFIPDIL